MTAETCVFCEIAAGRAPAAIVREWPDAVAFRPRHPVTPGHVLVIPRVHVPDVGADPSVSATAMAAAAELAAAEPDANVITSKGAVATQTVRHLHLHVVPRRDGDGLALPWASSAGRPEGGLNLVYAREPLPDDGSPSVFLAGPTPRAGTEVPSWRPSAVAELSAQWHGQGELTVLTPESRHGIRAREYHDQVDWECEARERASAVLYWIPRDVTKLPGFTTNVEFGYDTAAGRPVVLGDPPCPNPERNRYLAYLARRHGIPVSATMAGAVAAALHLAVRRGGEGR